MWIPDIRPDRALLTGAMVAAVAGSPVQAADSFVLGVCQTATSSAGVQIRPMNDAGYYLVTFRADDPRFNDFDFHGQGVKVGLIKTPAHGKVVLTDTPNALIFGRYIYMPIDGYIGQDQFVMQAKKDGVKVQIRYFIHSISDDEPTIVKGDYGIEHNVYCNPEQWKISATSPEFDNTNLQTVLGAADLGNGVTVDFASLTGSAVGRITGSTITLDANAAGYGWFIDYTPTTNTHPPVRHYG